MKLLLNLILLILINFSISDFVTITPHGNEGCNNQPYGVGYTLPMGTCIEVNGVNLQINSNSTHFQINYLGANCSNETPVTKSYLIDECVSFQLLDSTYAFSSILSTTSSLPTDAIEYKYYYYSNFCSGPSYSIWMTNGFSDTFSKYLCVNNKPEVFECSSPGDCSQINTDGCTNKNVVMPFRIVC